MGCAAPCFWTLCLRWRGRGHVYVADRYRGRKIEAQLLAKLIEESEREGFWTMQAGILPENKASVKLHESGKIPA